MTAPDQAWTDDLLRDPHTVADKRSRVQRMFAAIAPAYDRNNRLHSLGQDQRWRRRAVRLAGVQFNEQVVDVACGTGNLTFEFFSGLWRARAEPVPYGEVSFNGIGTVVGVDFTFEMLPIANRKSADWKGPPFFVQSARHAETDRIAFLQGDATALPLADASADVVSIAFGIRNVQEPLKALAEFYRVLRPGGRVIVLEFSRPTNRFVGFLNDLYCKRIMPHTATWLSGDRSGAYKYLPQSVATFMNREQMSQSLRDAGFVDVTEHPMTFGVAVVYRGYKR